MTVSSEIRAMVVAGFGREDVIARYGAGSNVNMAYKRAVAKPVVRRWRASRDKTEAEVSGEIAVDRANQAAWQREQAKAGIYHLLDLKRAGHSPRRTEFSIPPDREQGARIVRPLAAVSFMGSHFS